MKISQVVSSGNVQVEDKTLGIMMPAFEGLTGNGGNEDDGMGWFLLRRDAAPPLSGIMGTEDSRHRVKGKV